MLTAKDGEIDKVVGLELGADDYVTKPYSARELVARIRAVLRRRGERPSLRPTAVEAGPVRMDVERHIVTVDGEPVALPLKEFDLLEILLRNAGRVLTRGQLIDRVWGADYVGDTKTLDVHVKRLRAKIEPDPGATRVPADGARARLQVRGLAPRPDSAAARRALRPAWSGLGDVPRRLGERPGSSLGAVAGARRYPVDGSFSAWGDRCVRRAGQSRSAAGALAGERGRRPRPRSFEPVRYTARPPQAGHDVRRRWRGCGRGWAGRRSWRSRTGQVISNMDRACPRSRPAVAGVPATLCCHDSAWRSGRLVVSWSGDGRRELRARRVREVFGCDRRRRAARFDFAGRRGARAWSAPTPACRSWSSTASSGWPADIVSITRGSSSTAPVPRAARRVRAAHARGAHDRQPLHRRVRPRRRRPARRPAGDHPLEVRRGARRPLPGRAGRPDVLYVDNGQVITGAGTAAGVDTLLHLLRREWGAAVANALAREMVVPPHRDGGQAQYIGAGPRRRGRPAGRRAGLGQRAPRRGPHRRHARPPRPDEPAQLRPPVQGHDRHHAARLAARPAAGRARGAARGDRRAGRGDRPARRVRDRGRCASSSPGGAAPRRRRTARRSRRGAESGPGAPPVQLDAPGWPGGARQALAEAEFGQPA